MFIPIFWDLFAEDLEVYFEFSIDSFCFSIEGDARGCPAHIRHPSGPVSALPHAHIRAHALPLLLAITSAAMAPQTITTGTMTREEGEAVPPQVAKERAGDPSPRFFKRAQRCVALPPVSYAWDATNTTMPSAMPPNSGTEQRPVYEETNVGGLSSLTVSHFVSASKPWQGVQTRPTPLDMFAQGVGSQGMAPSNVLRHRRTEPLTPYKPSAWHSQLDRHGLLEKYPNLHNSLMHSFDLGIPSISRTYVPPNNPSINKLHAEYEEIVEKEFQKGRYIGPFSKKELEAIIGPFQSSPLSLVPKPGKPGKYCAVHDFSHLRQPSTNPVPSINSTISSHDFPCTWGTFSTICLIIYRLPPGSQASIRDVAEAYQTIPVRHDQWPGLVVRLREDDSFTANICNNFGLTSAGGVHGLLADAGTDLFQANGIGPVSKWVDDHIFFRIRRCHLHTYNNQRHSWGQVIDSNGGRIHEGSRIWYRGDTMPNGHPEEFDEDMASPLCDLSSVSACPPNDALFTYADININNLSETLGIPWEVSKSIPFGSVVPYLSFIWDLDARTVAIPEEKKIKYLNVIEEWKKKPTHALAEVQGLYGKLLHISLVIPAGRAYLTSLEAMLSGFNNSPFVPHTPPRNTPDDLKWWTKRLSSPSLSRNIPGPVPLTDLDAFSDASSGFGIGITIGNKWRAWCLLPGWKADGRDIGWAEAVRFELLTRFVLSSSSSSTHFKVYGDNKGVVEGWWKGRSRNRQTNTVFRRVHSILEDRECTIHTRYVPSKENPADKPSRGIYPHPAHLLPNLPIPTELLDLITDFDSELPSANPSQSASPNALPKPRRELSEDKRASVNAELDRRGEEFFSCSSHN